LEFTCLSRLSPPVLGPSATRPHEPGVQLRELLSLARQPQSPSRLALVRTPDAARAEGSHRVMRRPAQVVSAFARRTIAFEMDLIPLRFEGLPLKKVAN